MECVIGGVRYEVDPRGTLGLEWVYRSGQPPRLTNKVGQSWTIEDAIQRGWLIRSDLLAAHRDIAASHSLTLDEAKEIIARLRW